MIWQSHTRAHTWQNYNPKIYMHPRVQSSTIHESQEWKQPSVPNDAWTDKENVVCIYAMEYYAGTRNKGILPFTTIRQTLRTLR